MRSALFGNARDIAREKAEHAAQVRGVANVIDRLLAAPTFNGWTVNDLATRAMYATAVALLLNRLALTDHTPRDSLVPALLETANAHLKPWRVGVALRVFDPNTDRSLSRIDPDSLREIAARRSQRGRRARIALAVLGLPVAPWSWMPAPERAAFVLGWVVATMRARPS